MKKSLEQLIQTRRSVFPSQYTGGEIPQDDILKNRTLALQSPARKCLD
jgi:hypothetical protein